MSEGAINPSHIMQIGTGFMASRTLLSAVELELFTVLGAEARTAAQLGDRLGLHPRSLHDFLDALVSLGLLAREGDGAAATYANTPETGVFLDKNQKTYLGGILEMAAARLYPFWSDLTKALTTGDPQNEVARGDGDGLFEALYADEARLEQFLRGMQGIQMGNFMALLEKVDLSKHGSLCDVGGANGTLAALVAHKHPEMKVATFDLPPVAPVARRHIEAMGAAGRVEVLQGSFFESDLPEADVITMGNILHDWSEDEKKMLIGKAHAALSDGGMLIAIENVIDDARRENTFGLLMSLNMLIETPAGFDYTGAQFDGWCKEAGFSRTEVVPLAGPTSAAIAYK